jgi:hypothetical protein
MTRWRVVVPALLAIVVALYLVVRHVTLVSDWLEVHLGIVNESGPYYAFWSGFGSDIAEFGILGALATALYQAVKRYNCHFPGCWRIGIHPAAGGQFHLCYRHHPDMAGTKLTQALIQDLHRQHKEAEMLLQQRVHDIHEHLYGSRASSTASSSTDAKT